jgi:hypothetical protein
VLDEARSRAIDAELAPLADPIGHEVVDKYRGRLYYG